MGLYFVNKHLKTSLTAVVTAGVALAIQLDWVDIKTGAAIGLFLTALIGLFAADAKREPRKPKAIEEKKEGVA